ncbi:hypothetical protein ACFO4L_02265 [Bacillus daqingensis]|uniref:Uncharacterized protein n=2 Tax=Bacillaceae TaxID=186817 RepID=A0A969PR91_9BACI|nr:hypothetical protein [Alkalicoccus luteus]NJP38922.1 hypothetical protein [Alkalicoccus luteus]
MDVRMNTRTRQWLLKQGGVVTVDPFVFPGLIKNKRILIDHDISHAEPENKEAYHQFDVDGITVYLHRSLTMKHAVTFSVGGRAPFEQMQVSGVRRLFTENTW